MSKYQKHIKISKRVQYHRNLWLILLSLQSRWLAAGRRPGRRPGNTSHLTIGSPIASKSGKPTGKTLQRPAPTALAPTALRTVYRTGALREAGVDDCVETLLGVCVARWLSSGKLKGT